MPSVRHSCYGLFPSRLRWTLTLTHLLQAGHSGHGRAVSRGSAEVGGAAGTLPAAFLGRLHAATHTHTHTRRDSVIALKVLFGGCFVVSLPGVSAVLPVGATPPGSALLPGALPLGLLLVLQEACVATPGGASLPGSDCTTTITMKRMNESTASNMTRLLLRWMALRRGRMGGLL